MEQQEVDGTATDGLSDGSTDVATDAELGPGDADGLALPGRRWPKRVAVALAVVLVAGFFGHRELGTRPFLALELLRMEDADRTAREQLAAAPGSIDPTGDQIRLLEAIDVLDTKHAARLAEIVDDHGWPDRGLVGRRGSKAALLLLRHADDDCDLQRRAFPLVEASDVADDEVAVLEDAIANCVG